MVAAVQWNGWKWKEGRKNPSHQRCECISDYCYCNCRDGCAKKEKEKREPYPYMSCPTDEDTELPKKYVNSLLFGLRELIQNSVTLSIEQDI